VEQNTSDIAKGANSSWRQPGFPLSLQCRLRSDKRYFLETHHAHPVRGTLVLSFGWQEYDNVAHRSRPDFCARVPRKIYGVGLPIDLFQHTLE
jgi:hypothetical protein